MTVYLLRHGETEYNARWRYLGKTDQPLSSKGREELARAGFSPEVVYVSRSEEHTSELQSPA